MTTRSSHGHRTPKPMAKTSGKTYGHQNQALKLQEPKPNPPPPFAVAVAVAVDEEAQQPNGRENKFFRRREFCERAKHERENKRIKWINFFFFFTECYSIMYLYTIL
jgi:hypothetical protein